MRFWVAAFAAAMLFVGHAEAATTGQISPQPIQHFTDNNGNLCVGCKLFTYAAGTTTKQTTYTDSSLGTPNANPVVMNARGEAPVWLTPGVSYKFVLAPSTDSDPPTSPFWTVDNIGSTGLTSITDVTTAGAKCDGTTNDYTAISNLISTVVGAGGGQILFPPHQCLSNTGIIVPPTVTLVGSQFSPSAPPPAAGNSGIICPATVSLCVTLSGDGTSSGLGNKSAGLRNMLVSFSGTPLSNSDGVEVLGGYNPILDHVMVYNSYNGFAFVGTCTTPPSTGCTFGISSDPDHLYTGAIAGNHIYINNWPELRISQSRFGTNGSGDLNANSYIYITGGAGGGGEGPNGLIVADSQFNQGINAPTHFVQWANITGAGSNVVEWKFEHDHIEDTGSGALFASDSTTTAIDRLNISASTFNTPSRPMFALNAATQPSEWEIVGNEIFCSSFNLAPTSSIQSVTIVGNRLDCASHFTATAGTDTLALVGNFYGGNLTLDGAGNWGSLSVNGGAFTSGSLINSTTAASFLSIDMPGQNSLSDCSSTIGLAFGGTPLAGADYTTRSCKWQIVGNEVTVNLSIILNSISGASGNATLVGLPKAISSNAYGDAGGPTLPYVANLQSLTGAVGLAGVGGTTTMNFVQSAATGTTTVAASNFTGTAQLSATLVYPFQ